MTSDLNPLQNHPKGPDSNQHLSFNFMLQNFLLLTSHLEHHDGNSGFGTLNVVFHHVVVEHESITFAQSFFNHEYLLVNQRPF